MDVSWIKCTGSKWCPFANVNMSNVSGAGIYIIWRRSDGKVVYVGQGDIADRIRDHRNDPAITRYDPMDVTWTTTPSAIELPGIELYLARVTTPLEGSNYPQATWIPVNLPEPIQRTMPDRP